MTERKHSALFRYIERLHGERPWGAVLDAGTGVNSIRWIAGLPTDRWTAVTGSAGEAARVRNAITVEQRPQDRILLGNWADAQLLKDEIYDTALADYLLGAIEGFAPFFQPYLFSRLRPLVRSAFYVTGLEPYVPAARPENRVERLVWEIGRFRDACILLSGGRPYREYPSPWVTDHLHRAGFVVRKVKRFAIRHRARFVNAQIDMCAPGLKSLNDRALAQALSERGEALRAEALEIISAEGALRCGRNYVVAAEPE